MNAGITPPQPDGENTESESKPTNDKIQDIEGLWKLVPEVDCGITTLGDYIKADEGVFVIDEVTNEAPARKFLL